MEKRDSISISGYLCNNLIEEFGIISMYVDNPVKEPDRHADMLYQLREINDYLDGIWVESVK